MPKERPLPDSCSISLPEIILHEHLHPLIMAIELFKPFLCDLDELKIHLTILVDCTPPFPVMISAKMDFQAVLL